MAARMKGSIPVSEETRLMIEAYGWALEGRESLKSSSFAESRAAEAKSEISRLFMKKRIPRPRNPLFHQETRNLGLGLGSPRFREWRAFQAFSPFKRPTIRFYHQACFL